jgi:aminomethyltransferase
MLNRMVTRDVAKIGLNRVAYCVWCTDEGRMIDDGTIFKLADDRFMLTCGSACTAWLEMSVFGFDDVTVTDITDDLAALALQGPTSCATLRKMGLAHRFHGRPRLRTLDTARPGAGHVGRAVRGG